MKKFLPRLFVYISSFLLGGFYAFQTIPVRAASASHVVISEVQIGGVTSFDEFIELYNPTLLDVNMNGWRLTKKTAGGTESNLIASISGEIPSHGYFLFAPNPGYTGSALPDVAYATSSASISDNNTVTLYSNSGITIVDEVGFGSATASETAAITNPASGKSRERKANSLSASSTMGTGGLDEFLGNGEDTDNNSTDFVLRNSPQPQNSLSSVEPVEPTATPTSTPTQTPTLTPTSSPTPTPTIEPTFTPTPTSTRTPTLEPTATPTVTVTPTSTSTPTSSPTPTLTPTLAPTSTPTATSTPTSTPVPTLTPTTTPTLIPISSPSPTRVPHPTITEKRDHEDHWFQIFRHHRFQCYLKSKEFRLSKFKFHIAYPWCHFEKED